MNGNKTKKQNKTSKRCDGRTMRRRRTSIVMTTAPVATACFCAAAIAALLSTTPGRSYFEQCGQPSVFVGHAAVWLHAALVPKRHDASLCAVKSESSTKESEKQPHAGSEAQRV